MLKKVNKLMLGLAGLLAFSCGEDDKQDNPTPENVAQKNCLLTKELNPSGGTTEYSYNSAGKVDKIYRIDSNTGQKIRHYEISYNADGNISESKFYQPATNVNDQNTIYTYNADKLLVTKTNTMLVNNVWQGREIYKFKYNTAKQLIKTSFHSSQDTATISYSLFSYPAPDQVVVNSYLKDNNGNFPLTYSYHYYYDNKKNFGSSLGYLNYGLTVHDNSLFPKHNVISQVAVDYLRGTTITINYGYIYNAEGYPVQYFNPASGTIGRNYEYNCQ